VKKGLSASLSILMSASVAVMKINESIKQIKKSGFTLKIDEEMMD
jgi:hypothetical protein